MDLFGTNYLKIRNDFLLPLIPYGISKNKIEYWSLKDVLTTNIISVQHIGKSRVDIELSKEDFYRALHCEIELFLNKTIIQYCDSVQSIAQSRSWSYVSFYYFSFFCSTTFSRFLHRGYLFLSKVQKERIEKFHLAVYSTPIMLETGNYYFYTKEDENGKMIISLNFAGSNVHKLSWTNLEVTLRDGLPFCTDKEKVIYEALLKIFSTFSTEFPSRLRNDLNYNSQHSIVDINSMIPYLNLEGINNNYFKSLLALDLSSSFTNELKAAGHISVFLYKIIMQLYSEYRERSKFGSDFEKVRETYLQDRKINFLTLL